MGKSSLSPGLRIVMRSNDNGLSETKTIDLLAFETSEFRLKTRGDKIRSYFKNLF